MFQLNICSYVEHVPNITISSVGKNLGVETSDIYEIHLDQLAECPGSKNYKISVYVLEDISQDLNFRVEYS